MVAIFDFEAEIYLWIASFYWLLDRNIVRQVARGMYVLHCAMATKCVAQSLQKVEPRLLRAMPLATLATCVATQLLAKLHSVTSIRLLSNS